MVTYRDVGNSYYGTARLGAASGGTLTWGPESAFNTANTTYIAVSSLSPTSFVVAYQDQGNSSYGTARAGTVGGETLTWGAESVFNASATAYISISSLSPIDLVVAYRDGGNSSYGTVIAGAFSEATLAWRTESVFNASATAYISVSGLTATDFVVAYSDEGNSYYGTAIVGTVGREGLSWRRESVYNAAPTGAGGTIAVCSISAADFVIAYSDFDTAWHATAIVGHYWRLIGTAKTSASGGETVTVIIGGVSDVHSGLVPGEMYYLQDDGSLSLTPTGDRVGWAISETELILDQMW